ncbi:hypothetical protein [Streptomyces cuspidosporus]|uniref:Tetracycline repressor TetR C-terminal domain-containing protein n=1 Tax=Streptomyces cuspidosporus TaxID=66882 RepID=A0ABP5SJG1_9ACTN
MCPHALARSELIYSILDRAGLQGPHNNDFDGSFRLGLDTVLDGIAAHIGAWAGRSERLAVEGRSTS